MLTPQQSETLDRLFSESREKLYYRGTPELEKRMKNLRKWIPYNVEILLFYDYTLFGSGKNGTVFTESRLFCRNLSEDPRVIAYCDISCISVKLPAKSGTAELSVQDAFGAAIIWRQYISRSLPENITALFDTANRLVRLIELFSGSRFGTLSMETQSLARRATGAGLHFSPTAAPKPQTQPTPKTDTQPQKPRFTPMEPPSVRNKPRFTPIDPQSLTPVAPAPQKQPVRRLCICYAAADDTSAIWFRETLSQAPFGCVLQPADASAEAAIAENDALLLLYTEEMASQANLRSLLETAQRAGKTTVVTVFDGTPALPLFAELSVPVWDISPLREDEFVEQLMQRLH